MLPVFSEVFFYFFSGFVGAVVCGYVYCCYKIYNAPRLNVDADTLSMGVAFYCAEDDFRFTSRFSPTMQHINLDIEQIMDKEVEVVEENDNKTLEAGNISPLSLALSTDETTNDHLKRKRNRVLVRALYLTFELACFGATTAHLIYIFLELYSASFHTMSSDLISLDKTETCLASIVFFYVIFFTCFMFWPLSSVFRYRCCACILAGLLASALSACGLFAATMILWTWMDWRSWLLSLLVVNTVFLDLMWWGGCWWNHYGRLHIYSDCTAITHHKTDKETRECTESPFPHTWPPSHAYV